VRSVLSVSIIFHRAAAMQPWYCNEHLSVCPSVCLSGKRVHCDKTKATSANILIPYERLIHLVSFATQRMVCGFMKFWAKEAPFLNKG